MWRLQKRSSRAGLFVCLFKGPGAERSVLTRGNSLRVPVLKVVIFEFVCIRRERERGGGYLLPSENVRDFAN